MNTNLIQEIYNPRIYDSIAYPYIITRILITVYCHVTFKVKWVTIHSHFKQIVEWVITLSFLKFLFSSP